MSLSDFDEVISATVVIPRKTVLALCKLVQTLEIHQISQEDSKDCRNGHRSTWFLGTKCPHKVFPWFFPFEDFVFFAKFVD